MLATRKMCGDSIEMREMAARICRDYLHGAWKNVTAQNIGFKHISGGLSNWLYHVWLPETTPLKPTSCPDQVLIRVYGQTHGGRALEALITESVVFTLLSERALGPRLHGVFPGGRIEQYIAARPLKTSELADRELSGCVARKMAQIHTMEVPLSKEPRWLWDTLSRWQLSSQKKLKTSEIPPFADFLKDLDFTSELAYLKKTISLQPSPVVFCHNDFQEGNILLQEEKEKNYNNAINKAANNAINNGSNNESNKENNGSYICKDEDLVLIDFEYCSYNYRGFDIANHLLEWTYDYTEPTAPYYKETKENYPTISQQLHFIQSYLSELQQTGSKTPPESMLQEIRTYSLASHLFWGLWAIVNAGSSQITFGYWEYAVTRLEAYLKLKEELSSSSFTQTQQTHAQKRKIDDTL